MSSYYLKTKFSKVREIDTSDGFSIIKKADNDTVIEVTTFKYDKPVKTSYTLYSIEYLSIERAKLIELI